MGLRDEAAIDIQSLLACVKRGCRLVVSDLRLQFFLRRNVGWVGDDGAGRGCAAQRAEQIGLAEVDADRLLGAAQRFLWRRRGRPARYRVR